jgi:hypothetical protein
MFWESNCQGKVVDDSGIDLILRFQLERGCDGMKRCRKIKQMQRARLDSIGMKRDTVRWRDDVGWRRADTGDGKGRRQYRLG